MGEGAGRSLWTTRNDRVSSPGTRGRCCFGGNLGWPLTPSARGQFQDGRGGQERRHHGCHHRASSNWRNCCHLNRPCTGNELPVDQAMIKRSCIQLGGSESIRIGTNLGFKTDSSANSLCDPVWPRSLETRERHR